MRAFTVVALLAFSQYVSADGNRANRAFEDTINATLECVRGEMNVGWPDYGIPHFNPLQIEDLDIDFGIAGIDGISGSLNIQDTTFAGLTGFVVTRLSGTIGLIPPSYTVAITLNFPNPILSTKYTIDLTADDYTLDGSGTLDFEANNFAAAIDLKATILGGISLPNFSFWVSMDALSSFKITGVRGDEDYSAEISANILENGVAIIGEAAPVINDIVSEAIQNIVNNGGGGEEGGFLSELLDRCLGGR